MERKSSNNRSKNETKQNTKQSFLLILGSQMLPRWSQIGSKSRSGDVPRAVLDEKWRPDRPKPPQDRFRALLLDFGRILGVYWGYTGVYQGNIRGISGHIRGISPSLLSPKRGPYGQRQGDTYPKALTELPWAR